MPDSSNKLDNHIELPFFALGREAEKYLKDVSVIPDESFPHPQYWKRFHYNSPYSFVSVLKRATDAIA